MLIGVAEVVAKGNVEVVPFAPARPPELQTAERLQANCRIAVSTFRFKEAGFEAFAQAVVPLEVLQESSEAMLAAF